MVPALFPKPTLALIWSIGYIILSIGYLVRSWQVSCLRWGWVRIYLGGCRMFGASLSACTSVWQKHIWIPGGSSPAATRVETADGAFQLKLTRRVFLNSGLITSTASFYTVSIVVAFKQIHLQSGFFPLSFSISHNIRTKWFHSIIIKTTRQESITLRMTTTSTSSDTKMFHTWQETCSHT